jgi:hypothetical protein
MSDMVMLDRVQDAHGPHRSPESLWPTLPRFSLFICILFYFLATRVVTAWEPHRLVSMFSDEDFNSSRDQRTQNNASNIKLISITRGKKKKKINK